MSNQQHSNLIINIPVDPTLFLHIELPKGEKN